MSIDLSLPPQLADLAAKRAAELIKVNNYGAAAFQKRRAAIMAEFREVAPDEVLALKMAATMLLDVNAALESQRAALKAECAARGINIDEEPPDSA